MLISRATETQEWEVTQPRTKRECVRDELIARIPRWYSPWVHLAFPSAVGLGLLATAVAMLERPTWLELLAVPLFFLTINLSEWRIHKLILHRRSWPLEALFWRHTPEHHVVFIEDDMSIRSAQEFRLVLIPAYGIVAIFLTSLPLTAALWTWVSPNVALLWVATSMGYVVSYEWLHLSYHLPAGNPIGESRFIRTLRRHHAKHHTPELMQKWNFNVTLPFADWALGTIWHGEGPSRARAQGVREAR